LDIRFTGGDSVADITNRFTAAHHYGTPADALFSVYQVTNGNSEFAFVQAANWPRGFVAFNLYCYERITPGNWILRALAPINDHYFTNDASWPVTFEADGAYVKAVHRGAVVLSVMSRTNSGSLHPQASQR
jgi:hypothetical protein